MSLLGLAIGALGMVSLGLPAPGQAERLDRAIALHVGGDIEAALREYDAALPGLEDPIDRAVAHNNACAILVDLERYEEALERCREARRLLADSDETDLIADNRNNLALALQSLGQLERAAAALREALAMTGDEAPELEAMTRSNLGAVLTELGRFGEASQQYRAVEERAGAGTDDWMRRQAAIARVNRAILLIDLGDLRGAFDLLDAETAATLPEYALEIHINRATLYAALGDPDLSLRELDAIGPDAGAAAAVADSRARAHRLRGDLEASLAAAGEAATIAMRQGDRPEQMRARYQLARSYEAARRDDEAEGAATEALATAEDIGDPDTAWSAHALLARLDERAGRHDRADAHLQAALDRLETGRAEAPDPMLRATFLNSQRQVYETAHRIWAERALAGDPAALPRAYDAMQRAKSRSLLDALPERGGAARVHALAQVQQVLDPDAVLLEYFVDKDRVWRWTLRHDEVQVAALPGPAALEREVRHLLGAVHRGEPTTEGRQNLYDRLLGDVVLGPRLNLATDGFLHALPFALLGPAERPLGATSALVYWPSGSFIGPLDAPVATPTFAALATPRPPPTAPAGVARNLWQTWSVSLEQAGAEVDEADRQLAAPADVRRGPGATEEAFWELAGAAPAVLHVAAHAVFDADPGASAILLSPADASDGLLRQEEIAGGAVPARLAVLAACHTADLSGGRAADALNSLAGAFLGAGTRAVVASRWAVGDAESAAFMQQFYYAIGRGERASEALRRARARLIEAGYGDRPDVWSAYLVVGDARPLAAPWWRNRAVWLRGGAAALLAILIAVLTAARRQRRAGL